MSEFDRLEEHIGEEVVVVYVSYGSLREEKSILQSVELYRRIELKSSSMPFVGYGCGIRSIFTVDGKLLYSNLHIPKDYDARSSEDIHTYEKRSFGEEVANKHREEQLGAKRKWDDEVAELNKQAKAGGPKFIEMGRELVKPELVEEWVDYAQKNTEDFYSACVIEASVKVMRALSEGLSLEEADETYRDLGVTGFQAGGIASTVIYYHERGEEYKVYWNGLWGKKEAEGVINPAVWTVGAKEE